MLKLLRDNNKLSEILFMMGLSLLCLGCSIFRFIYTDTKVFLFLNWNLFLALIPWVLTTITILRPSIQKSRMTIIVLLPAWLLFFPNAPYILTDLFHLRSKFSMPLWFDLILILSFAWTGLLFGFLSLWDIEKLLRKKISETTIAILLSGLLFLVSFGIYLGRYLRLNSWDVVREPFQVVYDVSDRIFNPLDHPRTWGLTLFMGLFLNMLYWSFRMIRKREE